MDRLKYYLALSCSFVEVRKLVFLILIFIGFLSVKGQDSLVDKDAVVSLDSLQYFLALEYSLMDFKELSPEYETEFVMIPEVPNFSLDGAFYYERFAAETLMDNITDNYGNGCDELYGTRNLRPVLHGAAYRGGANNYYHKENKRSNHNPVPNDGLENLCEEGFSTIVYLYRKGFDTAPRITTCDCVGGNTNYMVYEQFDYYDTAHVYEVLRLIYESAIDENVGPVYLHCWNGWHASGFLGAVALRQFCGYSPQEAVNYWDLGTDGNNHSPRYQVSRDAIRDFIPDSSLIISDSLGNLLCPEMPKIVDYDRIFIDIEQLLIVPEAIPVGYSITLINVVFPPNSVVVPNPSSNKDLKVLVEALNTHKDLVIEVGGHTDSKGKYQVNKDLSTQRAKFVYDYLLKSGISKNRLLYKGYGSALPKFSNRSKEGRAANRRIEVKIIDKKVQPSDKLVEDE